MNIYEKLKNFSSIDNVSIVSIVSGMIVYSVDNYMAICGAITLLFSTVIACVSKYNDYRQSKLNAELDREIKRKRAELEFKEKEINIKTLEIKV